MKILIVSPLYPSSQNKHAYGFVHARSKIYLRQGEKVKVFVPSKTSKIYSYRYEGVDVIKSHPIYITDIVDEFDPDVLGVHAPWGWFRYVSKIDRPIVIWIHGAEVLVRAFHHYFPPWSIKEKLSSLVYEMPSVLYYRRYLMRSSAVVYVSKWMRRMGEIYTLFRHPFAFTVPNPVDTDLFKPSANEMKKIEINRGVSVRALEWRYGLDIAIRAFSNLETTSLTILGNGSLKFYLEKLAKKTKSNVRFVTAGIQHEELSGFYNNFSFFVAPSRTEAQGVAMCEAMSCGLPVIATRVGGIPEFVIDGLTGLLVPPENPSKLREAVKLLTSNRCLYDSLSENAREHVIKNLSPKIIYKKEKNILKFALEHFCKGSVS